MATKLYVGNLPYSATEEQLRTVFAGAGEVVSVQIVTDKFTNKSRGFGFVTFADAESAAKAREELNNSDLDGRSIRVDTATERPNRGGGGGGGGFRRD